MPNQGVVSNLPGWMIVTGKAAEVAGLAMVVRLLAPAPDRRRPHFERRVSHSLETALTREERNMPRRVADLPVTVPHEVPPVPLFIEEVADDRAHFHRAQMPDGNYLFAGFYSDGRVRMATPQGRRFSGIMVDQRAVMADLREDVSFEVGVAVHAHADDLLMLEMDGGPYDGQTLQCETIQ